MRRRIGKNDCFHRRNVACRGFLLSPGEKRGLRGDRDTGGGQGHRRTALDAVNGRVGVASSVMTNAAQ